jgi:hypothetical protein
MVALGAGPTTLCRAEGYSHLSRGVRRTPRNGLTFRPPRRCLAARLVRPTQQSRRRRARRRGGRRGRRCSGGGGGGRRGRRCGGGGGRRWGPDFDGTDVAANYCGTGKAPLVRRDAAGAVRPFEVATRSVPGTRSATVRGCVQSIRCLRPKLVCIWRAGAAGESAFPAWPRRPMRWPHEWVPNGTDQGIGSLPTGR